MTSSGGFSQERLERLHDVLVSHVDRGTVPGVVALVSRRGETHVAVLGAQALGGPPMRRDTLFRIASMSKPITAAGALILVEECKLRLDDPVDELLPELANRRVLRRIDGPLDDTVPAKRPITLRDLLTFRAGFGLILQDSRDYPIQKAMNEAGLAPGPDPASVPPDEWMRRLGALPLLHQPGEGWHYHTGADVLGVLIERAAEQSFEGFLRQRIFEPLGMKDTGFFVPEGEIHRLATSYLYDAKTGKPEVHDDPRAGRWSRPPPFASGGAGLVSTADDYLAFSRMLLDKGRSKSGRVLSRPSVELMTTDQLTPEQRAKGGVVLGEGASWGFGVGITIKRHLVAGAPGQFGWTGGKGTSGYCDPAEDLIGVVMTQRLMDSPTPPPVLADFWTAAYQAIDD